MFWFIPFPFATTSSRDPHSHEKLQEQKRQNDLLERQVRLAESEARKEADAKWQKEKDDILKKTGHSHAQEDEQMGSACYYHQNRRYVEICGLCSYCNVPVRQRDVPSHFASWSDEECDRLVNLWKKDEK